MRFETAEDNIEGREIPIIRLEDVESNVSGSSSSSSSSDNNKIQSNDYLMEPPKVANELSGNSDIVMSLTADGEQVPDDVGGANTDFEQTGASEKLPPAETMDIVDDGDSSEESSNIMTTGEFDGQEETICDCCRDGTVYDDDALVYCDSCDVCVHQSCYDVSDEALKEDTWYCDPCAALVDTQSLTCALCPLKGGAYRRRSEKDGKAKWVHVLCCNYVPGCYIEKIKIKTGTIFHFINSLNIHKSN